MTHLENIVRPFTAELISPVGLRYGPAGPPVVVEVMLGGMGGRTTSYTFEGNGFKTLASDDNKFKEVGRKSTKVRVENEDDPDSFVEFCRADRVDFKTQKAPTVPKKTTSFSDPTRPKKDNSEYTYQHPKDKACISQPSQPKKGC